MVRVEAKKERDQAVILHALLRRRAPLSRPPVDPAHGSSLPGSSCAASLSQSLCCSNEARAWSSPHACARAVLNAVHTQLYRLGGFDTLQCPATRFSWTLPVMRQRVHLISRKPSPSKSKSRVPPAPAAARCQTHRMQERVVSFARCRWWCGCSDEVAGRRCSSCCERRAPVWVWRVCPSGTIIVRAGSQVAIAIATERRQQPRTAWSCVTVWCVSFV